MEDFCICYQYGLDFHASFEAAIVEEEERLWQTAGIFDVGTTFMYCGL